MLYVHKKTDTKVSYNNPGNGIIELVTRIFFIWGLTKKEGLIIMYPYWYGRHYGMMPGNGWWLGLETVGFFLLILFLLLLYRNYMKHIARIAGPPTALDIAKERLAKGEITPEEFAAMKEHLK